MPAYKDDTKGTWYVSFYYQNWKGIRERKLKRGFRTKKDALEWEREFLQQQTADMDMTFGAFVELYSRDMKTQSSRFSAHLHMDEATPHLHVDFVPFTTGSKRGLDIRVSLKQALAAQGFSGGTRFDTEWNQWVTSEKEQLAQVMGRYGIEWEQLGTHEKHKNVLDYQKQERTKEVAALEEKVTEKRDEILFLDEKKIGAKNELDDFLSELEKVENNLKTVTEKERFVIHNASHYDDDPEYELPEPKPLMSAKTYHEKFATPLVRELKDVIRSILLQFFEKTQELKSRLERANHQVWDLTDRIKKLEPENERLRSVEQDYGRIRQHLGGERADEMIKEVKAQEVAEQRPQQRIRQKVAVTHDEGGFYNGISYDQ